MPINFAIKLAATVAMEAMQMGLQASKRTTGPRLDELTVTTADFGTPLPRFLGTRVFACPIIHAEDLKEVKHTTKVKGGGKQTTYSYLATFACAIADCEGTAPIDKVLRIWFDDKLVYDATGTGPISYASSLGIDLNAVMRIYRGTEDQMPDPRYASWCEDRYGPNSAPAYRSVAYLFFEELPVDNFGNRIPQIRVLVASAAAAAYPFESHTTNQSNGDAFAVSATWLAYYGPAGIEWWDVPTRQKMGASGHGPSGTETAIDLASDGTAYAYDWRTSGLSVVVTLSITSPLGETVATDTNSNSWGLTRVFDVDGARIVLGASPSGYNSELTFVASAQACRDFFLDDNNVVWAVTQPSGSSSHFGLLDLGTSALTDFAGLVTRSTVSQARGCFVAKTNSFFVVTDGKFYIIDRATMAITSSGAAPWGSADLLPVKNPDLTTFWNGEDQYSLIDGSLVQSVGGWATGQALYRSAYDPLNDAIIMRPQFVSALYWLYLDRVTPSGVTLGELVDAMCGAAALTDRDTSALTQSVAGYSWTRGDVKSQMEPLLDIHDVDARPHDFTIQFLPRGSAAAGTILTQDFAKNGSGSPRYKVTIAEDTDLPQMLRVNFADTGFDQQTNNVLSPLPADSVDTRRDNTLDLTTYAATPAQAQQLADRYMRRAWNSRETIENSLTTQCLALEPGDVTALNLDGIVQTARLTKQTIVGGRIDCTFVRDESAVAALNSATTGPDMGARDPETIAVPAPVRGFVIDAPLRQDSDQDVRPLLYVGAGAYAHLTYPGAVIYEATGAGTARAFDRLFATVSGGATWGLCSGALATANANLWDRGNTLTVSLQAGSLTSVTEADINADPELNLILVGSAATGWEYINFATATLNGDGSYALSDLKRGRRGTEWMCGQHAAGEAWILASSLDVDEMGTGDVGASLAFKAQSIGRALDAAPEIDVTYAGDTLKPYAPARIKWTTDGTDMFGEIIRRTRVGGAWVGGSTIPLSENSEAYSVDVYHAGVLKRTIAVTGTNLFTYTGAQIAADGNSVGVSPPVHVYQVSDAVGRGFALAA